MLDGPEDLHPQTPVKSPVTEVRRKVVQDALHMMMTRDLVEQRVSSQGISYRAGNAAAFFLESLSSPYIRKLRGRAHWLVKRFEQHSDEEFTSAIRELFDQWMMEFSEADASIVGDQP